MENFIIKTTITNGRRELIHSLSSYFSLPEAKKVFGKVNYKQIPYVFTGQYINVSLFKYDNDTKVMTLIEEYVIKDNNLDSTSISDETFYILAEDERQLTSRAIRLLYDALDGENTDEVKEFLKKYDRLREGKSCNFNRITKEVE